MELSIFADAELIDKAFLSDKTLSGTAHHNEAVDIGEELDVEVSEDIWIALQVEGHDEEGETSGIRLRDISAPLAAAGISILFLSTYISDVSGNTNFHLLGYAAALRIRKPNVAQSGVVER